MAVGNCSFSLPSLLCSVGLLTSQHPSLLQLNSWNAMLDLTHLFPAALCFQLLHWLLPVSLHRVNLIPVQMML